MKNAIRLLVIIGFVQAASVAFAADEKVSSYNLDIEFDPEKSSMKGEARVGFSSALAEGLRTFYLHGELDIERVMLNEKEIEFSSEPVFYDFNYSLIAKKVTFDVDEEIPRAELNISYQGHFHPSLARSPSDYMKIDSDGVFLRSYGYSLWFPVFLGSGQDVTEADFNHVRFKIPEKYDLVFVGEKVSEESEDGYAISTWRAENILLRDLQVTAQEYSVHSKGTINIYHYRNEKSRASARAIGEFTAKLLEYFSRNYKGDSNIRSLNLLEMPRYGDISSNNMVGIASETFQDFEQAGYTKRTIAHELVHPFVSVRVNRSDALYSLATEGFPSYFHLAALKEIYGAGFYDEYLLRVQDYYLENKGVEIDRRGNTRPPEVPLMDIAADVMSDYKDDYILWGRTKLFFDYLLRKMGEAAFKGFSKELFNRDRINAGQFVALCRKHLPGKSDEIHRWLYTNDFPDAFRIQRTAEP